MKLAEALQARADLYARMQALETRMVSNALVQEGESPAEAPEELLAAFENCAESLEILICRINLTNCKTELEGQTLTALLARRDILKARLSAYRMLADEAGQSARRATRSEIKILPTVSAAKLQKDIDRISKELRELDNKIQQCNWTTELL